MAQHLKIQLQFHLISIRQKSYYELFLAKHIATNFPLEGKDLTSNDIQLSENPQRVFASPFSVTKGKKHFRYCRKGVGLKIMSRHHHLFYSSLPLDSIVGLDLERNFSKGVIGLPSEILESVWNSRKQVEGKVTGPQTLPCSLFQNQNQSPEQVGPLTEDERKQFAIAPASREQCTEWGRDREDWPKKADSIILPL